MDESIVQALHDKQITEARKRMEILGIFKETQRQFFEDGKLSYSTIPDGAYFWMDEKDMQAIREFEKENHALVYSVIRSAMEDMILDSLLYVSAFPAEWDRDQEDLRDGCAIARVLNRNYPHYSDSGFIEFKLGIAGGLIRTA